MHALLANCRARTHSPSCPVAESFLANSSRRCVFTQGDKNVVLCICRLCTNSFTRTAAKCVAAAGSLVNHMTNFYKDLKKRNMGSSTSSPLLSRGRESPPVRTAYSPPLRSSAVPHPPCSECRSCPSLAPPEPPGILAPAGGPLINWLLPRRDRFTNRILSKSAGAPCFVLIYC